MDHLDLFSGIGGFSLGLESTGHYRTVAFCEIEQYPRAVLRKHWPKLPIYRDVRDVGADRLAADGIGRVDIVTGGFPCQDISLAGSRAGLSGERSGLWSELFRVITEVRPTWAIIENVPGLRTLGADAVLADLAGAGYATWPLVVGAIHAGAPHRRQRVWVVAHSAAERCREAGSWQSEPSNQNFAPNAAGLQSRREQSTTKCNDLRQEQGRAESRRKGAAELGDDGEGWDVADANRKRREDRRGQAAGRWPELISDGQWNWHRAPEPVLCRSHDGLSGRMDGGGIDGQTSETGAAEALPAMRKGIGAEAVQRQIRGHDTFLESKVLRGAVHGQCLCARCAIQQGYVSLEGSEIAWTKLRVLWGGEQFARASHRRQHYEQLTREHPDLMRQLSSYPPPPCSSCWTSGTWADEVPPVITDDGLPCGMDRRQRLMALGNAVVPQIVAAIGRAILEAPQPNPHSH